jgi:hypothetical protein
MADEKEPILKGKVTFEFTEREDGNWYSEIKPIVLCTEPRDVYKLALITASLQDHCQKNMAFMDAMIMTKAEVRKIHNEIVEEKKLSDVDRLQTKLPFESKSDGNSLEDNGYDKYDGVKD